MKGSLGSQTATSLELVNQLAINEMLLFQRQMLHLNPLPFGKELIHLMTGLVPEGFVPYKTGLLLYIPKLFKEPPLSIMVILNMRCLAIINLSLDPLIEFHSFPLLGFLFLV